MFTKLILKLSFEIWLTPFSVIFAIHSFLKLNHIDLEKKKTLISPKANPDLCMYHGQNTTNISDQYELCLNMSKYVDCCICIVQIRFFFFVKTSCHNQGCQLMHSWGNGDRCKQAITVWHFTMDQKARFCSKILMFMT